MSLSLSEIVRKRIRDEGPISFRDFMEMALYYPELGYYTSARDKFGKGGDYFTAPLLTNIYGNIIAKQLEEMWVLSGKGEFIIVEYGAGTGSLCAGILTHLKNNREFYKRLQYFIIEKSEALRQKQKGLFEASDGIAEKICWINAIEQVSSFKGCVLANEVLDNFSVHKVIMKQNELREVFVDIKKDFTEVLKPANDDLKEYFETLQVTLPDNFCTEVNEAAIEWLRSISLAMKTGFILTIDYGFPSSELYQSYRRNGTILCYYKHTVNDRIYSNIGKQDITAHVNFSALDLWGKRNGLDCCGFTDQSHFLLALGLTQHLRKIETTGSRHSFPVKNLMSVYTLLMTMGKKFKVLIQQKGLRPHHLSGLQFCQPLI